MVLDSPFHGEFSSADASSPATEPDARIALYNRDKAAITLASTDIVVITDITIVTESALRVDVFDGANTTIANGERIAAAQFGANGGQSSGLTTPHFCKAGTYPKVKTSGAGQVDVILHGHILSA